MFKFLTTTTPTGVKMMTDMSSYIDFVLLLFFAFGIAFQVPVATVLLVSTGLVRLGDPPQESGLRAARHLHRRRFPHTARRDLAVASWPYPCTCSMKSASCSGRCVIKDRLMRSRRKRKRRTLGISQNSAVTHRPGPEAATRHRRRDESRCAPVATPRT